LFFIIDPNELEIAATASSCVKHLSERQLRVAMQSEFRVLAPSLL